MRQAPRTARDGGFTLVELMIVVAIIGVLAALAIYGVSRYLKHAKTAEAARILARIEGGADAQYQLETPPGFSTAGATTFLHQFCPNAGPIPTAFPTAQKVLPAAAEWDVFGFKCLKLTASGALFYQYNYTTNGLSGIDADYTATAEGDLDGNGIKSKFTIVGKGGPFGDAFRQSFTVVNEDE